MLWTTTLCLRRCFDVLTCEKVLVGNARECHTIRTFRGGGGEVVTSKLYVVPCTIDHTVTGVHTSNACTPAPVSTDKAMAPPFHPTCIEYGSFSLFKVSHLFTRRFRKEYLFLQERSLISAILGFCSPSSPARPFTSCRVVRHGYICCMERPVYTVHIG
jgi:hypothetical protein